MLRALLACLAVACAPSADDPRSRTTSFVPATGEYRLYYLEPPWELVEATGTSAYLRIRSNLMIAGELDGGPGKYELETELRAGAPAALVAAEAASLTAMGASVTLGPRAVTTRAGVSGMEVFAYSGGALERSRRVVYLPVDGTRSLRLAFLATPDLTSAEVDAMIALVEIGPIAP